jgi:hypothetical protein
VDSGGNAVFAWLRPDATTDCFGAGCFRLQARARSANGTLSATQTISDPAPGQMAFDRRVALDASGDAVFVWQGTDGTTDCFGSSCLRVQTRVRNSDGTLSTIQILSAPFLTARDPEVAVDADGNAVFVWVRGDWTNDCDGGGCYRIQTRVRSADATLSAIQTLSAPGQHAEKPRLAADRNGNTVFVWERFDGTSSCAGSGCLRIQVRTRSAQGLMSATQTLSPPGSAASEPAISADPNGGFDPHSPDAVAGWQQRSASIACCYRIEAAVQIAPPAS